MRGLGTLTQRKILWGERTQKVLITDQEPCGAFCITYANKPLATDSKLPVIFKALTYP